MNSYAQTPTAGDFRFPIVRGLSTSRTPGSYEVEETLENIGSKVIQPRENVPKPLLATIERVNDLCNRPENWNGYNVAAPNPEAIGQARRWVQGLYHTTLTTGAPWLAPFVTSDAEGNVVFEWSYNGKELTIYVLPDSVEFIRTPSIREGEEIEDGDILTEEDRSVLWAWLID